MTVADKGGWWSPGLTDTDTEATVDVRPTVGREGSR